MKNTFKKNISYKKIVSFNSISRRLPKAIMIFLLIDIGLCLAYLLHSLMGLSSDKLTSLLNLDGEESLSSWYSSTKLFCVFILSFIFSYYQIKKSGKLFPLIVLPIIFLLMSIDESVQIHEWLGDKSDILLSGGSRVGTSFERTGIWMFVFGLPFLGFFLGYSYSLKRHFSGKPTAFKKLVTGMIILLTGALGVETLSNFVGNSSLFIQTTFEEGLEMIGVTIMLWAMLDLAIDYISVMDWKNVQQKLKHEPNKQAISLHSDTVLNRSRSIR